MKLILIADDEPQMTRVLKLHLERAGYTVETAQNGQAALTCIQTRTPDVLVTDIQMPIMTGRQLCLAIEEQYPQRTFPIFVMTSMADRDHREWTQQIKNVEFLEKPLSMRALAVKLEKHFMASETQRAFTHE